MLEIHVRELYILIGHCSVLERCCAFTQPSHYIPDHCRRKLQRAANGKTRAFSKNGILVIIKVSLHCSKDSESASIANTTVLHSSTLTTTFIANKLEPSITFQNLHSSHNNTNRMSSTNRIASLSQNIQPSIMTTRLTRIHTFKINVLDAFVDGRISGCF
jgi:hypothetical protein